MSQLQSLYYAGSCVPMQVEDMLKRSFAEWRAQRSQPKALEQLQDIEK